MQLRSPRRGSLSPQVQGRGRLVSTVGYYPITSGWWAPRHFSRHLGSWHSEPESDHALAGPPWPRELRDFIYTNVPSTQGSEDLHLLVQGWLAAVPRHIEGALKFLAKISLDS